MNPSFRLHLRPLLAALAAAVLVAGCGTRMSRSEIRAAAGTVSQEAASPVPAGNGPEQGTGRLPEGAGIGDTGGPSPASTPDSGVSPTPNSGTDTAAVGGRSDARRAGAPVGSGAAASANPSPAAGTPSKPGAAAATTPTTKGPGSGGAVVPPAQSGPKSPVKIGNVGSYTGILGAFYRPGSDAIQAWAKVVNARGGLNGHPVELVVADDQGDQARHRALVQQLVEQNKVLAFVANMEGATGAGSVEYLAQKRIPVIGTDTGGKWVYQSPMYFPQGSSGDHIVEYTVASPARHAVAVGKRKAGVLACQEVEVCRDIYEKFPTFAKKYGLEPVYRAQASVAQPDYTAECLAAQRAGVEVFMIGSDVNSVNRVGTSCARQGFHPIFGTTTPTNTQAKVPEMDGLWGSQSTFPWFQDNTPATQEYQAAVKQFGLHKQDAGTTSTAGWAAGKLFEKAAQSLPEPPTTEAILEGLWSLQNETLGGLVPPLTFTRDRPTVQRTCWFAMLVKNRQWGSPDGFSANCV